MKSKIQYTILWYLTICFVSAIALEFGFRYLDNGDYSHDKYLLYIPGLSVVVLYLFKLKRPIFKGDELGLSLKGWTYWILAPLGITAICLVSYGISILFDPDLIKNKEEIIFSLKETGFFFGRISVGLITVSLINALLGGLVSIPLFLGQELGWRAFMLPRLLKILKPVPAFLLGGLLWGIWMFLFLEFLGSGSTNPLVGSLERILFCIPLGIIFQYIYFKSQSIFVPALAHGALYKSFDTASLIFSQEKMDAQLFGPLGISGMLLFWAVALILFNHIKWHTNNTYHE